jgi:hypothetical protein
VCYSIDNTIRDKSFIIGFTLPIKSVHYMKKEIIIAILIGLFLGLFITYGVYQARTSISPDSKKSQNSLSTNSLDENGFSGELVLNSPADESITTEDSVTVSGTTLPESFVVVLVGNTETITSSDGSGNFSVSVDLEQGANIITVTVLDENGRSISVIRTITVSDDTLTGEDASVSATPAATPTVTPRVQ